MCFEIKNIRTPVVETSSNRSEGVSELNMLDRNEWRRKTVVTETRGELYVHRL